MTANFEELSSFYAKSYEWILENLYLIVGLNNIVTRGDYNKFRNENKTFENYDKTNKYNKLQWINKDEPFSLPLDNLDNKKRNAIQHYDSEIDYSTQKIIFNDKDQFQSMYLIEFASLCVDNFSSIFYILELVYSLRKIHYIRQNFVPHFKEFSFSNTLQKSPKSKKLAGMLLVHVVVGKNIKSAA